MRAFGVSDVSSDADKEAHRLIQTMEYDKILSVTLNDLTRGEDVDDKQIDEILKRSGITTFAGKKESAWWAAVKIPLNFIERLGNLIETLPKVAGYFELQGKMPDMEMRDFIRRKVGSPDFLDGGYLKPASNEIFLFSNAITQGIRADVEVATDPKTRSGFWWKTALINLGPKLLMFMVSLGLLGEGLRRMMEDASEYDKTNYTIVPLGRDPENGKTAYLRVPQDETGRLIGGLLWKALTIFNNKQSVLTDLANLLDFTGGQLPNTTPVIGATVDAAQFFTGRNPYDAFRGRYVIPDLEFRAGGATALKTFLAYEFEQLGGSVFMKTYVTETTPKERSSAEKILRLRVVSNVFGRFLRVSDYGQTERIRGESERARAEAARKSLQKREIVNRYVEEFRKTDGGEARVNEFERRIAEEALGHPARTEAERREAAGLRQRFKRARLKGTDDPRVDALVHAASNDEKKTLLESFEESMPADAYADLKAFLREEKVVDPSLLR